MMRFIGLTFGPPDCLARSRLWRYGSNTRPSARAVGVDLRGSIRRKILATSWGELTCLDTSGSLNQ